MTVQLPAGACDSHCHVIGPHERFPMLEGAGDIRSDSVAHHREVMREAGLSRALVVHPSSVYGDDHAALMAALKEGGSLYRGVAVATRMVTDAQLEAWARAGVVALRFVEVKDAQGRPFPGSASLEDLAALAPRMRALGLHAQIWADCADVIAQERMLTSLGFPIVLDHMGKMRVSEGPQGRDFARLVDLVKDGQMVVKLSLCRNSRQYPTYDDLWPFHDALVNANPDQLVWGSDWPHIRMGADAPQINGLLQTFCRFVDDAAIRRRILVDTPSRLFGFPPSQET